MDETSLELAESTLRRRNPVHAAAAITLVTLAPPLLVAIAVTVGFLPLAALAPLALFGGVLLWAANPAPRERLGRAFAGELGLFFEGRRLAARSAITGGRVIAQGGDAPIVRFATRGGAIEIRVSNLRSGELLLAALHLDRAQAREARVASRLVSDPASFAQVAVVAGLIPALFAALGLFSHGHPVIFGAFALATAASTAFVLLSLLAPTTLVRRDDGVEIRWLWRRRFLPHDAIDDVRCGEASHGVFGARRRTVSLSLRSGEVISLSMDEGEDRDGEVVELVNRLRDAVTASRALAAYRSAPVALLQGEAVEIDAVDAGSEKG